MAEELNTSSSPPPPDSDSADDDGPQTSLKFTEYRCKETYLGEMKTPPITIIDQPSSNERIYHIHTKQDQRGVHFINKSNMKSMSSALPLEVFMPKNHYESLSKVLQKATVGSVISDGVNFYSIISDKRDAKNISGSLVENTLRKLVQYLTVKGLMVDLYYIMRGNRKEFRPDQFVLTFSNTPVHLICHRLIKMKRNKNGFSYQLPPDLDKKSRGMQERGIQGFSTIYSNPTWAIVVKDTSNPSRKSHKKRAAVSKVDECLSPIDPNTPGLAVLTPKNYRAAQTTVSPLHSHNVSHVGSQISPEARRTLFSQTQHERPSTSQTQHEGTSTSQTQREGPSTSQEEQRPVVDKSIVLVDDTSSVRDTTASRKRKHSEEEQHQIETEMSQEERDHIIQTDLRLSESSSSSSTSSSDSSDEADSSSSGSDSEEPTESNKEANQETDAVYQTQTPLTSRTISPKMHPPLIGTIIESQTTTTPHFLDKPAEACDEEEFITPKNPEEIRFRIQKYVQENDGDWASPAARMRTNTQVNLVARQGSKTLRLNPLRIYEKQQQKSRKKV